MILLRTHGYSRGTTSVVSRRERPLHPIPLTLEGHTRDCLNRSVERDLDAESL
jgi:hypothetical protein